MKYLGIIIGTLSLALISCSRQNFPIDVNNSSERHLTLSAYTDNDVHEVKTSLSGLNVLWSASDRITVFNTSGTPYHSSSTLLSEDKSKATFGFESVSLSDPSVLYAIYPMDVEATINTSTWAISTTLPTVQTASEGSFGEGANLSLAYCSGGGDLRFKNVGAFLSLTLGYERAYFIDSISFSASSVSRGGVESYMTGTSDVSIDDGGNVGLVITGGQKHADLKGDFAAGKDYYLVVYPGDYEGLTITISGDYIPAVSFSNPNSLSIERNDNLHIAKLNVTAPFSFSQSDVKEVLEAKNWKLLRYGWWNDGASPWEWYQPIEGVDYLDDTFTFSDNGDFIVDQAGTYKVYSDTSGDIEYSFNGDETWSLLTEDGKVYVQFGGDGFPSMLGGDAPEYKNAKWLVNKLSKKLLELSVAQDGQYMSVIMVASE